MLFCIPKMQVTVDKLAFLCYNTYIINKISKIYIKGKGYYYVRIK